METQILIGGLKKALKLKGVTYSELAQLLNIAERSVGRMFKDETITVDRMLKICAYIDLTLPDLNKLIEVELEHRENQFSLDQEEFFAENFPYLTFYNILHEYDSVKKLAKDYNIDDGTIGKLLGKLEKMDLLEWLPGNEARLFRPRKVVHPDGPIITTHGKRLINQVIDTSTSKKSKRGFLLFPHLSKKAQKKVRAKMEELVKEIRMDMEIEYRLDIPTEFVGIYMGMDEFNQEKVDQLQNLRL